MAWQDRFAAKPLPLMLRHGDFMDHWAKEKPMHYLKRRTGKNGEDAVSPVVGVMLMLVVTIIIAAVVSGFSGGLIGGSSQKTPTLAMDVKVVNMGSWTGSGFFATVTGVSEPIQTRDIKIATSWSTTRKSDEEYPDGSTANSTAVGETFLGGNTAVPLKDNVNHIVASRTYTGIAPFGFGSGIGEGTIGDTNPTMPTYMQQFGNYSLTAGTTLFAKPCGAYSYAYIGGMPGSESGDIGYGVDSKYEYTDFVDYTDPAQAVLGYGWENLRAGDTVTVRIIHIPSGKAIFQKDVAVTES